MSKLNNFSPNMLKVFDECQQKFFFKYVEKISLPQRSKIFEKGKKIHALANYYLSGENIEKMEKSLSTDEKTTWESLKTNKYFEMSVVNTEYNLSCRVEKYWIGGRLDAFMQVISPLQPSLPSSYDYYILDYKTGQIPQNAKMDFQTVVYLLCADKFLKHKGDYKSLRFVYLGLKNNVEEEILLTDDLKKQMEEKIISTCAKIDFAIKSNVFVKNCERCKKCEYCKICN